MKALLNKEYGSSDRLTIGDYPKPIPNPTEVLFKVKGSSINAADWRLMRAEPFLVRFERGISKPKSPLLGIDASGVIEEVGELVSRFKVGDEIYVDLSSSGLGAFAEYVAIDERLISTKPQNLDFPEAASVPLAGVTALQGLRDALKISKGENLLINGASGGVGTFAIQLAKEFGANVTAVCSTSKREQALKLGADNIIDYKTEDFTLSLNKYDAIFAVNGDQSLSEYKKVLTTNGKCVVCGGSMRQIMKALVFGGISTLGSQKSIRILTAKPNAEDLSTMRRYIESGRIKPVIDKTYTFEEIPLAIKHVEEGHSTGKVVIRYN
jgi:NADPH:quinone reductase-like Zn-dependent oxidoreductase